MPSDSILGSDLTEYLVKPTLCQDDREEQLELLRVLAVDRKSAEEQADSMLYDARLRTTGGSLGYEVRRADVHETIAIRLYKPHPEKGYPSCVQVGLRSIRAIYEDLVECLIAEGLHDEYWTIDAGIKYDETSPVYLKQYPQHALTPASELPNFMHFICYAIEGGSEGHYVHVDLRLYDKPKGWPDVIPLFFGKYLGFNGAKDDLLQAYDVAARCAQLLNGWR